MGTEDTYVMLLSSLPRPGPLFLETETPLSRLRLEGRLKLLGEADRAVLTAIEHALEWHSIDRDIADDEIISRAKTALAKTESETLQIIVLRRLELRTTIAALRLRAEGAEAPRAESNWGFGRRTNRIKQYWTAPDMGLENIYPWIREADRLIRDHESLPLERLILEQAYNDLTRYSGLHIFDFEALVIYVLKWSIIDRWGRYNAEAASHRFDQLIRGGLQNLQAQGASS